MRPIATTKLFSGVRTRRSSAVHMFALESVNLRDGVRPISAGSYGEEPLTSPAIIYILIGTE